MHSYGPLSFQENLFAIWKGEPYLGPPLDFGDAIKWITSIIILQLPEILEVVQLKKSFVLEVQ